MSAILCKQVSSLLMLRCHSVSLYPSQSAANLVRGQKRLESDRFDNLSDAWCSTLLLIRLLSNTTLLFLHRGAQLDAYKPQPGKIANRFSCQDTCFVPCMRVLDFLVYDLIFESVLHRGKLLQKLQIYYLNGDYFSRKWKLEIELSDVEGWKGEGKNPIDSWVLVA